MKIYTRTGDAGTTTIVGGTRLPKNAPRIEAYGTVDELNSWIGVLIANASTQEPERQILLGVQNTLLNIGGYLAGTPSPEIPAGQIEQLEQSIDKMDRELPPLHNFILPGGCTLAAQAHVARTVCRRAERRILAAAADVTLPADLLSLINRLSDWLYTFARYSNVQAQVEETYWQR
ncbi:MAG: cob(I)yrinic acid a,c-diamide adenosyltransferase [Bacteroides sp.]|nr:cob(I)yrinic acid a,c-diamide adenosyltransferase [Bacteroides sp.]MCM1379485.1 cob(I)yrinic acid a,c-diamide adenosyltransferase [Bacteroides sp.]MCM1445912.1 cob(I)yrinic acid a,c-diamide adenosyltransferase [Prevotella sp.]